MPETFTEQLDLEAIAGQVGTPFFLYSADVLRRRVASIKEIIPGGSLQARYAMKACSTKRILEEIHAAGIWIDAVSGNEALRARDAGFPLGNNPPAILYTADVFRDNALEVITSTGILPNIGSPAMIDQLVGAGYHGPIGIRINPGFGHGHVRECDTGGPSSKHGIWHANADQARRAAAAAGLPITLLHTHIGSGPQIEEFNQNMARLVEFFGDLVSSYPDLEAVNLGGGIPHPYRPDAAVVDLTPLGEVLRAAQATLSDRAGRPIRVEIEPGRYFIAPSAVLVARVHDIKATADNDKGPGHTFAMVDAGFTDLVRPAMYGAYHHITVHGRGGPLVPTAVAGPLCESGDVFTRDADELIDPRLLPQARPGDLLVLHDAGAYGAAMSSNYNSIGRVPQVWIEDGTSYLMSRRETLDDIVRTECFEAL